MYAAHGPWREWYEVTFLWMLRLFQGRQKYKGVPHGLKYWIENGTAGFIIIYLAVGWIPRPGEDTLT